MTLKALAILYFFTSCNCCCHLCTYVCMPQHTTALQRVWLPAASVFIRWPQSMRYVLCCWLHWYIVTSKGSTKKKQQQINQNTSKSYYAADCFFISLSLDHSLIASVIKTNFFNCCFMFTKNISFSSLLFLFCSVLFCAVQFPFFFCLTFSLPFTLELFSI